MTRLVNEAAPAGAGGLCPAQPDRGTGMLPALPCPGSPLSHPSLAQPFVKPPLVLPLHPGVLLAGQDTQQEQLLLCPALWGLFK